MARGRRGNEMGVVLAFWDGKGYGELITLPLIGGVEWAEETGGVGGGVAGISFNILLGFKH